MEYLVAIILALLGGIIVLNKQKKDAQSDAKIAETKGKDSELAKQQVKLKDEINKIDESIEDMKREKEAEYQRRKNMTLKERAEEAKKMFELRKK